MAVFADDATACRIPLWLLSDERHWRQFVQSGYVADLAASRYFSLTELDDQCVLRLAELLIRMGHSREDVLICVGAHPQRAEIERRWAIQRERAPGRAPTVSEGSAESSGETPP